jgi:hypothetical protein
LVANFDTRIIGVSSSKLELAGGLHLPAAIFILNPPLFEKENQPMIRISKKSRINRDEIIARASRYFGKGGEGLDETERGPCCVSFSGAGGYVTVMVVEGTDQREVDIESREFEYQAKRFLESV